ncbi:MAG: formate dehydrogenase subunit gamma [Candidatus Sulfotelmatobacter sp.]
MSSNAISSPRTTGGPGERILRYTLVERVHHWAGALFYIYCLVTGLAFWSPYMYWLAAIVGGGPTARFWHPWFGLAFSFSMFWMYKMWRGDMATTEADLRWKKPIKHYIENDDQNLPPEGRFNYGQKIFFWLMFYGVILLLISGLGLWFVESIPGSLGWLRDLAITVHVVAALATIGGFIIHVYMGTAMIRGGFTSIIRGEVSTAWAKTHHRLWYDQVTKGKSTE